MKILVRSSVVFCTLFLMLAWLPLELGAQELPGQTPVAEFPPSGTTAFLQTGGPDAIVANGDWYSASGAATGNRPHTFDIVVPCTLPATQALTLELFDPESYRLGIDDPSNDFGDPTTPDPLNQSIDEIRPRYEPQLQDDASYRLINARGAEVASRTYPPLPATNDTWVEFATFTPLSDGCGAYRLYASTSSDDENAWRFRVTPSDSDNVPGTGDEITLMTFETSFQHARGQTCQNFHFFVPQTDQIRLNNFDLDNDLALSVDYFPPDAPPISGTISGETAWSNGGLAHPSDSVPGGDIITNPQPGWWRAQICVLTGNQYIFEAEGLAYFLRQPTFPELSLAKDDGRIIVGASETLTYTLTYANNGTGAALDAVISDVVPSELEYLRCSPQPCGAQPLPDGTTLVTYSLGAVPVSTTRAVELTARVTTGVVSGTLITNTAELFYRDGALNPYPPLRASDTDRTVDQPPGLAPEPAVEISKQVVGRPRAIYGRGELISYNLVVTNTGAFPLQPVPLEDTFDSTALAFQNGIPAPNVVLPGQLRWTDLTSSLGRPLSPGETISLTLRFNALRATEPPGTINTACVNGARSSDGSELPIVCSTAVVTVTEPSAVTLAQFSATNRPAGVVLEWRTSLEIDNYGFQIYRGASAERAAAALITAEIIAGRGPGTRPGANYQFVDLRAANGAYYWLADIDTAGQTTWHGPIQARSDTQSSAQVALPLIISP